MGEIRSTLDIILEKARGITVTQEDKGAFLRQEVEGKIRGWLQKSLDGLEDLEGIKAEIDGLDADRRAIARSALRRECLSRLTLEGDNKLLLTILTQVAGMDAGPIRGLLERYGEEVQRGRMVREGELKDRLKARGIWGSAVLPNLKGDPEWTRYAAEVGDRFHRELARFYPES